MPHQVGTLRHSTVGVGIFASPARTRTSDLFLLSIPTHVLVFHLLRLEREAKKALCINSQEATRLGVAVIREFGRLARAQPLES